MTGAALIVWLAQGFGVGRIPWAPGTFGSIVGVLWALALVATGSLSAYIGGTVVGILAACWICDRSEKVLLSHDPPSVVLDEIAALPLAFLPWVITENQPVSGLPAAQFFLQGRNAWMTLLIFVLFRLFDIAKPPPVGMSQRLPGGIGIVADDVLAALYVSLATLLVLA